MDTSKEIRLRLRFQKDVDSDITTIRQKFENFKATPSEDYFTKIRENHIFIQFREHKRKYSSPHLMLYLEPSENNGTQIKGLFGPDQTLWTLFIFLHFIVGGTFTIFGMFAFSNYTLKLPYMMDLIVMSVMIIVWFLLYIIARQIREQGYDQMNELEKVFLKIVES